MEPETAAVINMYCLEVRNDSGVVYEDNAEVVQYNLSISEPWGHCVLCGDFTVAITVLTDSGRGMPSELSVNFTGRYYY